MDNTRQQFRVCRPLIRVFDQALPYPITCFGRPFPTERPSITRVCSQWAIDDFIGGIIVIWESRCFTVDDGAELCENVFIRFRWIWVPETDKV